jgi:Ca-activated chloride channel family protein
VFGTLAKLAESALGRKDREKAMPRESNWHSRGVGTMHARQPGMKKLAAALGTVIVISCGSGSTDRSTEAPQDGDNFATGSQPLLLEPAPPGLCSGDGSQKECADPDGCEVDSPAGEQDAGAAPGYSATGLGGSSAAYGGSPAAVGGAFYGTGGTDATDTESGAAGEGPSIAGGAGAAGLAEGGAEEAGAAGRTEAPGMGQAGAVAEAGELGTAGEGTEPASSEPQTRTQSLDPQAEEEGACAGLDSSTPYTLYMSADDSNSTASATIARRMIRTGRVVPAGVVRPYEFLNYYDFEFEPAEPGEVRIVPQLSSCPVDGELSFQVALQAEQRDPAERAPLNVTFVLDTSGSMGQSQLAGGTTPSATPIELERAAVLAMAAQLQAGDIVSMVTWNTERDVILSGHVVSGPNDELLVVAAHALSANGGTDLHAGLVNGYQLAQDSYAPDRINRLVLISDGLANVGVTDEELIAEHADDEEGEEGIYLSGIGVGDGVNDTLMDTVTDAGRGAYVYLDTPAEAQKMLGDRFLQVIDLAARAVRLEVTLPYYMEVQKFYGEEISRDPELVRPQHLGPNDAMVFFQILQACDPSLLHGDDRIRLRATWETPFTRQARSTVIDATLNELAGDDAELTKAAAIASYAEALILVAKETDPNEREAILADALDVVSEAPGSATDPDLVEVRELLAQYAALQGGLQ